MIAFLKRQPPVRIIAMGFALVILLGSGLLMLPCSLRDGATLHYIDALYTSTSAVCVTGLIAADAGDTFSLFGQIVLLLLIQVGGLGVTAIGAGVILLMGRKMNLRGRNLVQEASNLESGHGVVLFVRSVFLTTLIIELCGAVLSFITFIQHYPAPRAVWLSLFHSVAAFNNSGFDVFGGGQSLIPYQHDVLLNLTTCALIFFGGIGFLVIREMVANRWHWKRYSMHARVVLSVSAVLTVGGTLLMRGQYMAYTVGIFIQFVIQIQHCAAGIAEQGIHALLDQYLNEDLRTGQFHDACSFLLPDTAFREAVGRHALHAPGMGQ